MTLPDKVTGWGLPDELLEDELLDEEVDELEDEVDELEDELLDALSVESPPPPQATSIKGKMKMATHFNGRATNADSLINSALISNFIVFKI